MDFDPNDTGRCVNCGYLGKRNIHIESPQLDIATRWDRYSGGFSYDRFYGIPWCFGSHVNFLAEIGNMENTEERKRDIIEAINKDRKCKFWHPWQEFQSPKETFDYSTMLVLQQKNEELSTSLKGVLEDSRKIAEDAHKSNRLLTGIIIALVVVQIMFVILDHVAS